MTRYRLYGLVVESDFELPAQETGRGPADLTVRSAGFGPVPNDAPDGTLLARRDVQGVRYFATKTEDGYVIRYPDVCDAVVNAELDSIDFYCPDESTQPLAHAVFVGNVMSKVMMLAGGCVLHASAVAYDGKGFAFIGPPGAGKTTVASMICSVGGRLVTDDVLRLVEHEDGWHAPPGTSQLRLRKTAASLAETLGGSTERTVDERTGVSLPLADDVHIAALVFPWPSRDISAVELTAVTQEDALMQLTRFPRIAGWTDHEVLARNFRWNARLARELPCCEARIPWGPPFRPEISNELVLRLTEHVSA